MKPRKRSQKRALGQLLGVVGVFLFFGMVLILHVWLPIQAQRAMSELKRWQWQVSQEKSYLEFQRVYEYQCRNSV